MLRLCGDKAIKEIIHNLDLEDNNNQPKVDIFTNEPCPECGKYLLVKAGKYGHFLSCAEHKCSGKKNINKGDKVSTSIPCTNPDCNGQMTVRKGKRGCFLGCSNYPNCEAVLSL